MDCITEFSPISNPNGGEALAIYIGINRAIDKHWKNVIIEEDSQVIIAALNSSKPISD